MIPSTPVIINSTSSRGRGSSVERGSSISRVTTGGEPEAAGTGTGTDANNSGSTWNRCIGCDAVECELTKRYLPIALRAGPLMLAVIASSMLLFTSYRLAVWRSIFQIICVCIALAGIYPMLMCYRQLNQEALKRFS